MTVHTEDMNISNLQEGAVVEQINVAIGEIINDIHDINKQAEIPREITVKIVFKPDEDRDVIVVSAVVNYKIAGYIPVQAKAAIGKDVTGHGFAREIVPMRQMTFTEFEPEGIREVK